MHIEIMNAEGSVVVDLTPKRVVANNGCVRDPSFTPNGKRFVFIGKSCKIRSPMPWFIRSMNIHGTAITTAGRQFDTAPAAIDALGPVAEAVGDGGEVLVDGGVRRGSDVVKAIAMGARAVQVGRPIVWGLVVDGEEGVGDVLDLLHDELDLAMALAGCRSIDEITPDLLRAE